MRRSMTVDTRQYQPTLLALLTCVAILTTPLVGRAQTPPAAPGGTLEAGAPGSNTQTDNRWEVTLDGRLGFPTGRLRVGEFPTGGLKGGGGGSPGSLLRLRTLGINESEALEGTVAFHATPRDAVRASYLYYFLDGSSTPRVSVVYNGQEFTPGHLRTNADFSRFSLAYERTLLGRPSGEGLIGSAGLTYVSLNPTLTGHGKSNSEDFYRQELPVPILGLRWEHPLGQRLLMRASVAGGGLPRVDSLRREGGTVYLRQSHADAGAGLAYLLGPHARIELGYDFTYFFQREKSSEDDNLFELIDGGVRARFTVRF